MKKQIQFSWLLSALTMFLSVSIALNAQQTPPQTQPADSQTQQPATPDQTRPSQTPDSQAEPAQSADAQSFTGTIIRAGDKYMFQDAATGKTYDIDHQEEMQKFEGKKVKVHGTLDASGQMIHLQ
jgi:uncharacterized protein YdeI (BOF family)